MGQQLLDGSDRRGGVLQRVRGIEGAEYPVDQFLRGAGGPVGVLPAQVDGEGAVGEVARESGGGLVGEGGFAHSGGAVKQEGGHAADGTGADRGGQLRQLLLPSGQHGGAPGRSWCRRGRLDRRASPPGGHARFGAGE